MTLDIDLLDPFGVRVDGVDVPVRGDYPRAILARLALAAGTTVTADQLIDDVWAERPDQAVSTLRAHISRMRTGFLGDAVVGDRNGYLLDIAASHVDLLGWRSRVEHLAAQPAAQRMAGLLAATSDVGREVLPGMGAHPFVEGLRRAVAEERRVVEEELGDLALQLGDGGLATAVLAGTVARHPLHERPVRLLATALARAARTSDAITTIDAFRDRLGERSGLRVSARLESLRASIVRLDPEVMAPPTGAVRGVRRVGIAIPLTRLVGRSRELAELQRLARTARLVTLVGPAGVGKTRLAIETARQSGVDEEQYLVDLADVDEPAAVVSVIADVLRAQQPTLDAVARRLRGGQTLLVLDNADRVIGALAVAVDTLLAEARSVRILVTSREPLRVAAEHELVVRPLLGDAARDAWQLFTERASDARGGAPLDETETAAARELCTSLEGSPLAIELATARLDVLGVAEVRAGVGSRTGGVGRHTSVRAALSWSVDLLDESDRSALVALARFAGAFTIEAVAGVHAVSLEAAGTLVGRLVRKSLVAVDRDPTGRRRYRLLESTRAFAATLDDAQDAAAWRDAHRRWFATYTEALAPSLRTFAARDTMAVLDGFRADLTQALAASVAAGDRVTAVRLAGAQAHYWYLRGLLGDGRRRLDEALAVTGAANDADEAAAQLELANLAYQLGDTGAAFVAVARALERAAAADEASVQVVALARAGYGRSLFGDPDAGARLMAQAHTLLDRAEPWARSEFHMANGQLLRSLGQWDPALAAVTEANRIAGSIGYAWMITSARYVMTKILLDVRRPREAIAVARSAIAVGRAAEDAAGALALVHAVAGAAASVERHEEGARLLGAADEIGLRYDYSTMTAEGPDAERLRAAIAAGLRPEEFDREYANGRRMGWDDVVRLIDRLPRAHAGTPLVDA